LRFRRHVDADQLVGDHDRGDPGAECAGGHRGGRPGAG
jgi:hypothetical protein